MKVIEGTGKVEVDKLAKHLRVSVMTIHRDLTELDELCLIERVHGGTLLPRDTEGGDEPPVLERSKEKMESKCLLLH